VIPEPDDQKGELATVYRAAVVLNAVIAWTRVFSDSP
jgi:hypothetical protein